MSTPDHEGSPTTPIGSAPAEFQQDLAEYLAHIEREDSKGLDDFRAKHPEFASRLGRQLEWLVDHMARGKEGLPKTIGPYRVQQRLGSGGMGDVYLCEQTTPFRRAVAVKVVKLDSDSEPRLQRFATEIQTLATLNHDGIAKVFEAGNDHGRPWFAMEYVPGKPITDFCAEEHLGLGERLRLFLDVCGAVEHAHRLGIIHRDLKPQNILVHGPRTEPVAKVIDFGLAKAVHPEADSDAQTRSGAFVGTPDYMSPEQVADASHRVVDTRVDVYALGVVLYELLTGVLPLGLWQRGKQDLQELIRAIREQQPSSPSLRVGTSGSTDTKSASACGTLSQKRLSRMLVGDLDSIVMKALAKDADRRYGSVAQLADDIRRHLRHEPVSSRPQTRRYVFAKFVRRRRAGVIFASTVALLVLASLAVNWSEKRRSLHRLEQGNLFGLAMYLQELRLRDEIPPAARAENVAALQQWLREFETVLAQRDRMQALVDTPETDRLDTTNPDGWATGQYAQHVLRDTMRHALDLLAMMTRPDAEIDKMRLRVDWAQRVNKLTVELHREAWARVRREVAADWGFEVPPQPGLVPLGRDETTRLQEFALPLPGAEMPQRVDGRWVIVDRTCPVFVLLPGGDVTIGAQKADSTDERFDAERGKWEDDPESVRIEPFFACEYEFTNGQWQLLDPVSVSNESDAAPPPPRHPVVRESGESMLHVVHAWGMRLPEAAEWEYLARGGTKSPRWCGDAASLQGRENVFDLSLARREDGGGEGEAVAWDDSFPLTAPVGSFPTAHPFLLHDVLGNAAEVAVRTKEDGWSLEIRGGSWHQGARAARATQRTTWDGRPLPSIGFRPVISVQK